MGAEAMFHSDSQNRGSNPNNLNDDYQDFLSSVANGADRASTGGVRMRFTRLYRDWFAPFEAAVDLHPHKAYYREVLAWWNTELGTLPVEESDGQFGLHVVVLRRKLRVIWLLSSSGAETEAMHRIDQLSTHYYRTYYLDFREQSEARRERLLGACQWLRKHIGKLKVCENPKCQQLTMYFVRRWSNNRYCSDRCSQDVDEVRRTELLKRVPPKHFKRSKEARDRMSRSAIRRWERERAVSGLERGERRASSQKPRRG
jgi:hypothetical protein